MNHSNQSPIPAFGEQKLAEQIYQEVKEAFDLGTPKLSDEEVQKAAEILLEVLRYKTSESSLANVGRSILDGLHDWFEKNEFGKFAELYEQFGKLVLCLADPPKYQALQQRELQPQNKPSAAYVLKKNGLELVSNKELELFSGSHWKKFRPAELAAKPNYIEHIARIYVYRNATSHHAFELKRKEKAEVVESFLVFLVWTTHKYRTKLRTALLHARFSRHLKKVKEEFSDTAKKYVPLSAEARPLGKYAITDPRMADVPGPAPGTIINSGELAQHEGITFVEAEAGAGKTTTLEMLALHECERWERLAENSPRIPVFVGLQTIVQLTIRDEVAKILFQGKQSGEDIPWDSLLLLVDGLNEIETKKQKGFRAELKKLSRDAPGLRIIITGRPDSFQGQFRARVFHLRRLSTNQLNKFIRKNLPDKKTRSRLVKLLNENQRLIPLASLPFYAAVLARFAQLSNVARISTPAGLIREWVQYHFRREQRQAPNGIKETNPQTKLALLARLAFETLSRNARIFTWKMASTILKSAREDLGTSSTDVQKFLQETRDNALLKLVDNDIHLKFWHDLYHDYFAACELEQREQPPKSSGVEIAVAHFAEPHWQECIRFFAQIMPEKAPELITRGAAVNPGLAWTLAQDVHLDTREDLRESIVNAAYQALSRELKSHLEAYIAWASMIVLADLGRAKLLADALRKQPLPLDLSSGQNTLPFNQEVHKELLALFNVAFHTIARRAIAKEEPKKPFLDAVRGIAEVLRAKKAVEPSISLLSICDNLPKGQGEEVCNILTETLVELDPDSVLRVEPPPQPGYASREEVERDNRLIIKWVKAQCEKGNPNARVFYATALRKAKDYPGVQGDLQLAVRWLREASTGSDPQIRLELALFLLGQPDWETKPGEGKALLKELANNGHDQARCELAKYELRHSKTVPERQAAFEQLLQLAEQGHQDDEMDSDFLIAWTYLLSPTQEELPDWLTKLPKDWLRAFEPRLEDFAQKWAKKPTQGDSESR